MNSPSRFFLRFASLVLLLSLIFAVAGANPVGLTEDDDDFSLISSFAIVSIRIPVYQLSARLRLGISIFALFIVYLGGRSDAKRFNDRTLDTVRVSIVGFLKTALYRAVFNFPLFGSRFLFSIPLFQRNSIAVPLFGFPIPLSGGIKP
jgi:hypothetical protein